MSCVAIPVTNDPHSELVVKLDGANYVLTLRWNARALAWFLDVANEDGDLLAAGRKVVVDWPILGRNETDPALPQGYLWAVDTSGQQLDPTLDDLGTRVQLVYEEAA